MSATSVSEQQIVEALHRVPANRWSEVLEFIGRLQPSTSSCSSASDISSLASSIWSAEALQQLPRDQQDAILREQAAHLIEQHRASPNPTTAWTWWTAREMRKLLPEQRDILLEASATIAAEEYASNPELAAFEAYGEDDLYVDSSITETR
jgi:hypothetical protein